MQRSREKTAERIRELADELEKGKSKMLVSSELKKLSGNWFATDRAIEQRQDFVDALQSIAQKGEKLQKEFEERKAKLKEKYDAEITERDEGQFSFTIENTVYTSDWIGDQIFKEGELVEEGPGYEFASKYTSALHKRSEEIIEFTEELEVVDFVSSGMHKMHFHGNKAASSYRARSRYIPTQLSDFTVAWKGTTDLGTPSEILVENQEEVDE